VADVERLLAIMALLRDPERGCPWDREQDFASIAPFTLEEAYEVEDAIRRGDFEALRDELGDLLLQVVYHARMAEEAGRFAFPDVVESIVAKLVRRHPHVFRDAEVPNAADSKAANAEAQTRSWEALKAEERALAADGRAGALDGVPGALPALARSAKLQRRAAQVGFDWPDDDGALAQLEEELGELAAEVRAGAAPERVEAELGDLLFAAASLARRLALDPETALRTANARFESRFRAMEDRLEERGRAPEELDRDEWLALWKQARVGEEEPSW